MVHSNSVLAINYLAMISSSQNVVHFLKKQMLVYCLLNVPATCENNTYLRDGSAQTILRAATL